MNEPLGSAGLTRPSPGRLLREARERQGLHVAALAASIKVAPKKLEALEADRYDELVDATFARALAQTVCRALKIDAAPVLALLPPPSGHRLEQVSEGLNTPFRARAGAPAERDDSAWALTPAVWLPALIVLAAVGVFFLPAGTLNLTSLLRTAPAAGAVSTGPAGIGATAGATVEPGVVAGATTSSPASPTLAPAPSIDGPAASGTAAAPSADGRATPTTDGAATAPPAGVLQVKTSADSWVEVTDASGKALVSRTVQAGEQIGVDGVAPFRVRIGNAAGTQLVFRGRPTELAAYTRDNVARLELR